MMSANSFPIEDLLCRICAEYAEMPGLRVTYQQAQRLWGLEPDTCRQVLERLIDIKFLTVTPSGHYARLTEAGTTEPDLRMARATLDSRARKPGVDRRTG